MARHTRTRLALLVAAEAAARLSPRRMVRFGGPFSVPDGLLMAPRPVTAGDAATGAVLYGGTFTFAGTTVEAGGNSIFAVAPPNPDWARELQSFSWLADLCAADTALARANARALIEEWAVLGRQRAEARLPDIAARRFLNWLIYAPALLEDADPGFTRKYLRGLGRQAARLRREMRWMRPGLPRLLSAIALTQAGLCLPDARYLAVGSDRLSADLKLMILPDGGPATRNPQDLLTLALDLLPLRESFADRDLEAPRALMTAIDRMLPMLRFFQHGDFSLALFNGMGATRTDLLDAVIALDDTQGRPVLNASFSGYQRLESESAIVLVDTGRPPPLPLSREAHAGVLSFEFTAGASRIVVNCGAPGDGHAGRRMAARKTAAHSTASVGEASSARFVTSRFINRMLGPLLRDGARKVEVLREDRADGMLIRASHDGYAARFGLIHERTLKLDAGGMRLDGADVLRPSRRKTGADIMLTFHLHPDVRATSLHEGHAVLLALPDGDLWLFTADGQTVSLEESVFFAGPAGPRRTEQMVIRLGRKAGGRLGWSFVRTGTEAGHAALALS